MAEERTGVAVKGFFLIALCLYAVDFVFRVGLGFGQDAATGITTILFIGYIFLAVWAAFGIFKVDDQHERLKNFGKYLLMAFIATFAPNIVNQLYKIFPGIATQLLFGLAVAFISQIWLWYVFMNYGEQMGKLLYWIFLIYIFSLIIAVIYGTGLAASLSKIDIANGKGIAQQQMYKDVYTRTYEGIASIILTGKIATQKGEQKLNETLSYATGDYYTGQVDKKAVIPNKVELKELTATQAEFKDYEPVSVYATLSTQMIDMTPPPTATITCNAANDGAKGIVKSYSATPKPEQVELRPFDAWDITCSFKEGTFKDPPTKQAIINISVQFDFSTQAYLKTYWMDKARLQELKTAKQDPLAIYDIADKNPVTIYTSGPLKTGMRLSSQSVQGLDKTIESDFTLGVTMDNAWNGKIAQLRSLVVFVPKGMRIVSTVGQEQPPKQIACNDDAIAKTGQVEACDDTLNNIYYLEPKRVDASKFLTLIFNIKAGPADYEKILSKAPITARYFKTTAAYTYVINRVLNVPIMPTQQATVSGGTLDNVAALVVGNPTTTTTGTEAIVSYTTNQLTKDKITHYSPTLGTAFVDVFEDGYAGKNETAEHTVHISGLVPNTKYNYKITSLNRNNIKAVNQEENYTFTTGAS
jgi:hypothetical protein